ncbi:MAG TPA: NAD(P)/FAD-dependent oxidoreductase [Actinomycetota bacterium]|nr:NAD(P)/FAD-dependent oxidoreductase [Actinomycetota bacterium]
MSAPGGRYDVVVVGGGHNGLTCAGLLARAGMSVLVVERRDRLGGAADTIEIAPGVRAPLAHGIGRLRRSVVRDLQLERHGLRFIRPDELATSLQPDGRAVRFVRDPRRTADGLREWSTADAAGWPSFDRKVRALASVMAWLHSMTPPDLVAPSMVDAVAALKLGNALRGLGGPSNLRETIRVLPTAVADFVEDHLESDAVRAAVAVGGIRYTAMGPRAAGSTAVLLAELAGTSTGPAGESATAVGGPGALSEALGAAVRASGGELRCGTEVVKVAVAGDRVTGVVLAGGQEIAARAVVSGADPKRTLLGLVDPEVLGPTLGWRAGNIRQPGTVAKVHLVLDAAPAFTAFGGASPAGRILVGATGIDQLDLAFDPSKYGRVPERPFLDVSVPTATDRTLAPEGTHVVSAMVQWVPFELREGAWDRAQADELADLVAKRLEEHAPGLTARVTARHVLTPPDLEREYGLTGGHPLHAEPGLDQFFAWRPGLGMARYRLPIAGLYLCGSGAHPGGGITGAPGANAAREVLADLRRR